MLRLNEVEFEAFIQVGITAGAAPPVKLAWTDRCTEMSQRGYTIQIELFANFLLQFYWL
jgi:hypothetical protein